jgi:hypothetical protein
MEVDMYSTEYRKDKLGNLMYKESKVILPNGKIGIVRGFSVTYVDITPLGSNEWMLYRPEELEVYEGE